MFDHLDEMMPVYKIARQVLTEYFKQCQNHHSYPDGVFRPLADAVDIKPERGWNAKDDPVIKMMEDAQHGIGFKNWRVDSQ